MILKLALKNLWTNKRNYSLYFLTASISIIIFFSYTLIQRQNAYLLLKTNIALGLSGINQFFSIFEIVMLFLLTFLLVYAWIKLFNFRKKELGIYLSIGISKLQIAKLLFYEILFLYLIVSIFGLFIGYLVSNTLFKHILDELFIYDKLFYKFKLEYILRPLKNYGIISLAVFISTCIYIFKLNAIEIIKEKKLIDLKAKNPYLNFLIFIISIGMSAYAYHMLFSLDLIKLPSKFLLIFWLNAFSVLLFIFSFFKLIHFFTLKFKTFCFKSYNIFFLKQLYEKFNSSIISLTLITFCIILSTILLCFGLTINRIISNTLKTEYPFAVSIETLDTSELKLNKHNLVSKIFKLESYKDKDNNFIVFSLSNYNDIAKELGFKQEKLNANEILLISNNQRDFSNYKEKLNNNIALTVNNYDFYIKKFITNRNISNINYHNIIIINNDKINGFTFNSFIYNLDIKLNNIKEFIDANKNLNLIYNDLSEDIKSIRLNLSIILYYLGIIFMLSGVNAINTQQITSYINNFKSYNSIYKLGLDKNKMSMMLFKESLFFAIMPLIISIFHCVVLARFFLNINSSTPFLYSSTHFINSIFNTAAIVLVFYSIYFVLSYFIIRKLIVYNKNNF